MKTKLKQSVNRYTHSNFFLYNSSYSLILPKITNKNKRDYRILKHYTQTQVDWIIGLYTYKHTFSERLM